MMTHPVSEQSPPTHEQTTAVLQQLRTLLTQERALTPQVAIAIADTFNFTEDRLPEFFAQGYEAYEDYELDLVFSPLFTPKPHERTTIHALSHTATWNKADLQQLVKQLTDEGLTTVLRLNPHTTFDVALHEVMIDRFVQLMGLHHAVNSELQQALLAVDTLPVGDVSLLSRASIVQQHDQALLVLALLNHAQQRQQAITIEVLRYAVEFLHTYKPTTVEQWVQALENHTLSCEADMSKAEERSYHDHEIKAGQRGSEHDSDEAEQIRQQYHRWMQANETLLGYLR